MQGTCHFGDGCRKSHDPEMMSMAIDAMGLDEDSKKEMMA
jgi:hypothetical protein